MAEAISTKSVEKFNGNNYQGWKFQMRRLLVLHRIWGIVDGTKTRPAAGSPAAEIETWEVENARAMSWLSSTLELAQRRPLICETACELGESWWFFTSKDRRRISCYFRRGCTSTRCRRTIQLQSTSRKSTTWRRSLSTWERSCPKRRL